jgi:hypothetical protein
MVSKVAFLVVNSYWRQTQTLKSFAVLVLAVSGTCSFLRLGQKAKEANSRDEN